MGRRDKDATPNWGKRTPPKSERATAAAEREAEERRKAAGISRSHEAMRTPALRMLGEKSKYLAVDLGLATGIAVYGRDGRLESVRTRRFQSKDALRAASASILDEVQHVHSVLVEGGGDLAEAWERAAVHRGIHFRTVQASAWRAMFLYERESRDGAMAKESAIKLAAQVIAWSETRGVSAEVGHDAAEAILVGLYGVVQAGWLREVPRFRR